MAITLGIYTFFQMTKWSRKIRKRDPNHKK